MISNDRKRVRRGEILKELGLTPVWRVRERTEDERVPAVLESTQVTLAPVVAHPEFEEQVEQVCVRSDATEDVTEKRRATILRMDWDQLKESVEGCVACRLCNSRTRTVFGVGDPDADWLYVGEGPGAQEDALGEPFVGQAGKLLDNMLAAIGLKRGRNVFIANIVKCRPPGNREPSDDEAQCCEPYLARQIQLIKPKLIIALGKTAARNLLNTDEMTQQFFTPALPLRFRRNTERQQMCFFRPDCHYAISKDMSILLQYPAMIACVERIAEIARSPRKKKNFPFNRHHCIEVGRYHSPYSGRFLQLGTHRSFSFRATLFRI